MSIIIGNWPEQMHSDFEQVKRIESGKKLKKDILSIDMDKREITIQGSSETPYTATLDECTCADFSIRQSPCKHIYCLAAELGLLNDLPVYKKKASSFRPSSEIEKFRQLYESGEISADAYVKICTALSKIK